MGLAAGIIVIFVIMVAFFISYGKAFKIKNEMLNEIEQHEGMDLDSLKNFVVDKQTKYVGKKIGVCKNSVYRSVDGNTEFIGFTMEVVVYMQMDRTILGDLFSVSIPITGETKLIEKGNIFDNYSHSLLDIDECGDGASKTYTSVQGW